MADLQARVVQPGDIGLVGLIGHGRERGSEVYVGDLGPFQQGAAGETGLTRYSPYWQSSGLQSSPREMLGSVDILSF